MVDPVFPAFSLACPRRICKSKGLNCVGQGIVTAPTSACYNGLHVPDKLEVGGRSLFRGRLPDQQINDDRRFSRIPVMEGEFILREEFGVKLWWRAFYSGGGCSQYNGSS